MTATSDTTTIGGVADGPAGRRNGLRRASLSAFVMLVIHDGHQERSETESG